MFAPTRLLAAIRPAASLGVLAAVASVTVVFAATPFLIPEVASSFDVTLGVAGLISTAQVAGFALSSFLAGRMASASRPMLVGAGILLAVFNGAGVSPLPFGALLVIRFGAGVAMGIITWIAWSDATRHEGGIGDVAAVGPVAAMVTSPGLAWLAEVGGHQLVYGALAALATLVALLPSQVAALPPVGRTVSPSRSNRVLLAALALFTLAGSAIFVFAAVLGERTELSGLSVSIGFSLNALAGIAGTRVRARQGTGWLWMAATALCSVAVGLAPAGWVYLTAMTLWGFAFWVAIPEVFRLLAARSLRPEERVGDAQSLMGLGRVFGPAVGGLVLGADRFMPLTAVASSGLFLASLVVGIVERSRERSPSR